MYLNKVQNLHSNQTVLTTLIPVLPQRFEFLLYVQNNTSCVNATALAIKQCQNAIIIKVNYKISYPN